MVTLTLSEMLPAGDYDVVRKGSAPPTTEPPVIPPVIPPQPTGPIPPGSIVVPWTPSQTWNHIPMQCTQTLVFVLDVPADAKPGPYPNQFNFAQHLGLPTTRQVVLSRVAGSFELTNALAAQEGEQISIPVLAGSNVTPGQRYFINVRNWSTDLDNYSCVPGTVMGSIASWVTS